MKLYVCRIMFTDGKRSTFHFTDANVAKRFANAIITHNGVKTLALEDDITIFDNESEPLKISTAYANMIA